MEAIFTPENLLALLTLTIMGYIHFAMGFSILVEALNLRLPRKSKPVHLKQSYTNEGAADASQSK